MAQDDRPIDPTKQPEGPDPIRRRTETFDPAVLDRTVIAVPLLREFERVRERADDAEAFATHRFDVIIDLHLRYPGGLELAQKRVKTQLTKVLGELGSRCGREAACRADDVLDTKKSDLTPQYLFGALTEREIRELVARDRRSAAGRDTVGPAIYRVWFDFPIQAHLDRSCATIKADAARVSFAARGGGIVWGVIDSGIDRDHPHFARHRNLELPEGLDHVDFTGEGDPLRDGFGHGTHVAGILAGELQREEGRGVLAAERERDAEGEVTVCARRIEAISGVAPECKLLSLKVLDQDGGSGRSSDLICALATVQDYNRHGRDVRIHGVNMSLGYDFDPEWFACGQSPLCVEVDRLVGAGVVVVSAAGNTGYGWVSTRAHGASAAGLQLTINDPGNAERAITVGATHRDMPHLYGVSYFSSKGPTGDGRLKPDLVAPGERILSCAAGGKRREMEAYLAQQHAAAHGDVAVGSAVDSRAADTEDAARTAVLYRQESGTSMAAPHVSGAIAALLSIRREFIGQPERIKKLFLDSATDLGRDRPDAGHPIHLTTRSRRV